MLSIALYTKEEQTVENFKSLIQKYFADNEISGRYQTFNNPTELLTVPSHFDVYIMDLEEEKEEVLFLGFQMKKIDSYGHFVYIDSQLDSFCDSLIAEADCFLTKPITSVHLFPLLNKIRKMIKEDSVIVSTPEGDRRIRTSDLNYINIENRCLCYHLVGGELYDGRSLRGSFEKSITPLQHQRTLLFIPPSLLINIENIEILNTDHLYFVGGEKLYFPRKHHDAIEKYWHDLYQFANSKFLKDKEKK